jgi:hypothetical protein
VLFLRRFGFSDATRTMSFAANGVIGRSWRLVTLDDAAVTAVGGPRAPRQLARLAIIVAVAGGAVLAWWLLTRGVNLIDDKIKPASTASTSTGQAFADAIFIPIVAAFITVILLTMLVALVTSSTVFLSATYVATRRAERAKKVRLNSEAEVRRRSSAIAKRGSRVFAPRLLVVAVANEVWRHAVSAFAQNSAVVIIDVSIPSDSLRWEISTLLPTMGRRCILVGRLDLLTRQGPDGRTVFASPLGAAIDGQDVLAYQPDGRSLRRFSRALQATIESRATR